MKLKLKVLSILSFVMTGVFSYGQGGYCVYQVEDFLPGASGSNPYQLVEYNGEIYFAGIHPSAGAELLKTDGNFIQLVEDIRPGGLNSQPNNLTVMNGVLYFSANDGTNGTELWKYDGVNATLAADINPGAFHSYPSNFTVVGDKLYFSADNGTNGIEVWVFDGSVATMVEDLNPGAGSSMPLAMFGMGTDLFISADNGTQGFELHRYNGTTMSSYDINPGSGHSQPNFFYNWNGTLYFSATDGTLGTELWKFDNGPVLVQDIQPGGANGNPIDFTAFQGNLYFRAATLATGSELYKYDGSTVTLAAEIMSGALHGFPDNLIVYGTKLMFTANNGTNGYELYEFNGTTATIVQEIGVGGSSAFQANNAEDFVIIGTKMYLVANDGTGEELWVYDGTTVEQAKDLNPGAADANPTEMFVSGTDLFFTASNGSDGEELHRFKTQAQLWDSIQVVTCGNWTSPGGQSFSGDGNYQVVDNITSQECPGCDSTLYIDLTIQSSGLIELNYNVINCGSWTSAGGQTYTTPGTYFVTDTFNSVLCPGTDSVINVDLEIVQLSNSVISFSGVLVAQANGANYQWLDCDNNMAFIPGATDQDFIPTASGNYAVALSLGGCQDTSACFFVEVTSPPDGINEFDLDEFVQIYPNPAKDQLTIQTELTGEFNIRLMNHLGQEVISISSNDQTKVLDVGRLSKGLYLVEISNLEGRTIKKLIIE
ncbi:T9SS type A sorting domain-containing protein [Paracrocinitomix mangrovi]|uniref:T9SS type A sorting domain-containing protein n=1 Tax=Paracrocinitomix mangrovi TaxID=2862509 RepID=UPI001C8E7F5D|nr:T9SS type A sorting domain-containing protein [Paracrocinitomix mangrovi]UKN02866.1 T9SS type A sorting domain-containing protein [Paracrocinitomix mangrovi]